MFPRTRLDFSGLSRRYSPRKGTIFGSLEHPDMMATRSEYKPEHAITYLARTRLPWTADTDSHTRLHLTKRGTAHVFGFSAAVTLMVTRDVPNKDFH